MIELRTITPEEHQSNLLKELQDTCLITAVEKRCDEINDVCGNVLYAPNRFVQELLIEIIDLIKLYGGEAC